MTDTDLPKDEKDNLPPVQYAPFNSRMFAAAVDILIIMVISMPVVQWIMAQFMSPISINDIAPLLSDPKVTEDPKKFAEAVAAILREKRFILQVVMENSLDLLCIGLYMLPFWFRYSSTPGKMLLRLQILDAVTHQPLTRKQAILRFLCYILSFIPLTLGFLWIIFNKKRRGWHDILANTIVVVLPKKKREIPEKPATDQPITS